MGQSFQTQIFKKTRVWVFLPQQHPRSLLSLSQNLWRMENTWIACMASIIIVLIIAINRWNTTSRRKSQARLPSGALGWPLVGETIEFMSCAYSSRPESFMDKRRDMYGKVFKSHLFGSPTIVSTDPEVNKFVLQSSSEAFVPFYPASLTELVGKSSILLINGSLQRRMHGLIGAFFKSPSVKAQITRDMQRHMRGLLATWNDGQLVHIQETTKYMVFQVLVKGLMGVEKGEQMLFLKHQFQEFIAGLMSLPLKIPGSRFYRSLQAKKKMVKLVKDIVQEKRRCKSMCAPSDIIDVLVSDGTDQLTDDLIADNVIDLMIPGEDSVPVLITLAIKFLGDCPLALQQLEEENMQLKQKLPIEDLVWTDYMSLSFTQNVITETLRMGNVISGVMRKAVKEVEIKGHLIPRDWCVFTYFRSIHLDKDFYDDPYKFNPWRWKDKDIAASSFTPFGGGQRLCPGLDIARLVASVFLHHLITSFTWVAEEDHVVNFPTVRMEGSMPIKVIRKKEADIRWCL